jgi:AraC-like DNA-binding protein
MKAALRLLFHTSLEKEIERKQGIPPGFYHELSFSKASWAQLPTGRVTVQEVTGTDYAIWQWNFTIEQQLNCFIEAEQGTLLLLQPIVVHDAVLVINSKQVNILPKMYLFFYLPAGTHVFTVNGPSSFFIFIEPPLSFLEGLRKEVEGINELCQCYLKQQTQSYFLPIVPMLQDNWMRLKRIDVPTLKQGIADLHVRGYIIDVLDDLGKMAKEPPRSALLFTSTKHKAILLKQYLLEQLFDADVYSLQELSKKFYAEPRTLTKAFQQLTGKTILQFVLEKRMEQARRFVLESKLPVMEIAFRCGFNDVSHFIRSFKKKYGQTPGSLRGLTNEDSHQGD